MQPWKKWAGALTATAALCGTLGTGCKGEIGVFGTDSLTTPNNTGPNSQNSANSANSETANNRTPEVTFECDPAQISPELPLRRLSKQQYVFTISDVLDEVIPEARGDIWAAVQPTLDTYPDDTQTAEINEKHGGFKRLDQAVQQEHIDASLAVATAIANQLTSPQHLGLLAGDCATDGDTTNDATCIDAFIREFGTRTLRREMTDDDMAFYRLVFDSDTAEPRAFRDTIAVFLTSPDFFYHLESGTGIANDSADLSAHELANRLSYHFWQSKPDAQLLAAAQDGSLLDPETYEREVRRVFADPKTERSLETFYREWLWLDEIAPMDALAGSTLFDNFAGENPPSGALSNAMVDEVVNSAIYYTLRTEGTFSDFFLSPHSFATGAELAAIYGVDAWDGTSDPPRFPEADGRAGLLTRAALLSTGTANTRPVMKGFFARKGLLCTTPPPPDENADLGALVLRPDMTTREVVEEITEQPGTSCSGCHQLYLNPIGFSTENFDSLGRARTHQVLFDADGNITGEKEVNTVSIPRVLASDSREAAGATEVAGMMLESGLVESCVARNYFRFTHGRIEDDAKDGCALEGMRKRLADGESIQEAMVGMALDPNFRRRTMTGVE